MSVSEDIAAQSLANDEAIAVQSSWTSGYMGLGGGLLAAIPAKPHKEKKAEAEAVAPPAPVRHVSRRTAPRVARRFYDPNAPVALIAETLDHTGENIATLGTPREPR